MSPTLPYRPRTTAGEWVATALPQIEAREMLVPVEHHIGTFHHWVRDQLGEDAVSVLGA